MAKIIDVNKLYFADKNSLIEVIYGIIAGLFFLALSYIEPAITIGIPSFFASKSEQLATIVIGAPFAEELFFSIILPWVILAGLPVLFGLLGMKILEKNPVFWYVILFVAVPTIFSIFHATAYAGSLNPEAIKATSGLFLGAILFRVLALGLLLITKNFWTNVAFHSVVNAGIAIKQDFVTIAI